jgi:anti-sigma B factor antagonist
MRSELPPTSVLDERIVEGVTIVYVQRGLRGSGEATLRDRLDTLVRQGRLDVLINLRHMPYVDSAELGRLIRAHLSVRQAGGRVKLCGISEKVMSLLRLTRLDTVLDLYGTEEEALVSIRGQQRQDGAGAEARPAARE